MHICFVSSMHGADDKRVHHKEARALVAAGFTVSHVVRDTGQGDVLDGVCQIRFAAQGAGIGARLRRLRTIYRLARGVRADVYHCNEADSWAVGVALTLGRRARLVHDVHEIYSSDLAETRFPPWARPFVIGALRMAFAPLGWATDRFVFAKASVGVDYPLVRASKKVVVENYVELPEPLPDPAPLTPAGQPLTVLHLGAINRQRGWPQVLDALAQTHTRDVHLRVVGWFGDGSDEDFLARTAALGLEDRVTFPGQIPYDAVPAEVARADIGLIAFQPVMLSFTHALPHKLFDYMLAGLPVVVPDFAVEVARIVREADCGLVVDVSDPAAIATAFDRLVGDPGLRQRLGANGRRAVLERYNWQAEATRFSAAYASWALTWEKTA